MAIRTADAEWHANLAQSSGHMRLWNGVFEGSCDFRSRMGEGKCTNREPLLDAAHAGCSSMAPAFKVTNAGFTVKQIHTIVKAYFEDATADGLSTGSNSARTWRSRMSRQRPSRNTRRTSGRTTRFCEYCAGSTSICEPSSCEFRASISSASKAFVWRASPPATTE